MNEKTHIIKTTGAILDDGTIVEMLYDPDQHRTSFASYAHGRWNEESVIKRPGQPDLAPYRPTNTLIDRGIVRFPSKPEPYGTIAKLTKDIQSFIHRYVDLSPTFEAIAAEYIRFTWVYDAFNELPYLRVRGDYGTGKTRFLLVVGSLAYKPIFGSGASTVSPLFHLLERFSGTLVIDEADFRFSDEKADLVKILNNGNVRGFPVLRSVADKHGEFTPRAFHVYGPKIIASRGTYEDRALESRFITEAMGGRTLRTDIPINLPAEYETEAAALRNKLLMYRFEHRMCVAINPSLVDRAIDARLNQVFVPLLSIIEDTDTQSAIMAYARGQHEERLHDREDSIEADVLTVLRHLMEHRTSVGVAVGEVATLFNTHFGKETSRPVTDRWIGTIIRTKLGLTTRKSNGRFVVPVSESEKLSRLYERYGIDEEDVAAFATSMKDDLTWEPIVSRDLGISGMSSEVP